jgi:hypothetical protein
MGGGMGGMGNVHMSGSGGSGGFGGMGGMHGGGMGGGFPGGGQPQAAEPVYSSSDPVYHLSKSKFPDVKANYIWLVHFYKSSDPNTGAPYHDRVIKAATALKSHGVKVGVVDCDTEAELCQSELASTDSTGKTKRQQRNKQQVLSDLSLPVFKTVVGKRSYVYDAVDSNNQPIEISAKALYEFVSSKGAQASVVQTVQAKGDLKSVEPNPYDIANLRLPSQVHQLLSRTAADKVKYSSGLAAVLLTSKFETPLLLKSLAFHFRSQVAFGESRGGSDSMLQLFLGEEYHKQSKKAEKSADSDESSSRLLLVCSGSDPTAFKEYTGDMKSFTDIEKFITGAIKDKKQFCDKKAREAVTWKTGLLSASSDSLMKKPVKELMNILTRLKFMEDVITDSGSSGNEKSDIVTEIMDLVKNSKSGVNSKSHSKEFKPRNAGKKGSVGSDL